jgi:hypothetical protein
MARKSIEERVASIEAQLAGKTLEEHFREQAELIDRRFAVRDAKWDARFRRIEQDVGTLKSDVGTLKGDVGTLKGDVGVLKKDMVIVREGIAILLKRG